MRALDSLVRSIGGYGSLDMTVISPLNPPPRRPSVTPTVPLPLLIAKKHQLSDLEYTNTVISNRMNERDLPSNDNNLLTSCRGAFMIHRSSARLYSLFFALDEKRSILLDYVKLC